MRTTEHKQTTWSDKLNKLVELSVIPNELHRICLYGPPGTGKSTWAQRLFGRSWAGRLLGKDDVERIALHKQQFVEDLVGGMGLVNGSTCFQIGVAPRCMDKGKILVMDEVDQFSPETRSSLHSILDDKEIACVTLPDGQRITPAPGFCVVGTTNASPDSLPEALRDRFDLFVYADKPAQGLLSRLSAGSAQVLTNHYAHEFSNIAAWQRPLTARGILAFERLALALGNEDEHKESAAEHIFGQNALEILNSMACAVKSDWSTPVISRLRNKLAEFVLSPE